MKKTTILALLLGLTLSFDAQAQQKNTSWGIKLNTNLTDVKLSELQGSKSSFHAGASVAGFARIRVGEQLFLQPELMVSYTEAGIRHGGEKLKFKYAGIELPVYLLGTIQAGKGKILLGAGPHIGYGLSADSRIEGLSECDPLHNKIELDHWYAGGGVIAGYEFRNRISLHGGYQYGWDISSGRKSSGLRTQTISLGIAYRF